VPDRAVAIERDAIPGFLVGPEMKRAGRLVEALKDVHGLTPADDEGLPAIGQPPPEFLQAVANKLPVRRGKIVRTDNGRLGDVKRKNGTTTGRLVKRHVVVDAEVALKPHHLQIGDARGTLGGGGSHGRSELHACFGIAPRRCEGVMAPR